MHYFDIRCFFIFFFITLSCTVLLCIFQPDPVKRGLSLYGLKDFFLSPFRCCLHWTSIKLSKPTAL